ncbi:hypothetical protein F0344_03375 [Streptomyces finlayi]|uniref:Uncharacterized protein n=1 Tax=Streptomyces finlayi TaxID=67296 RepID=A0A7G7BEK7_9ACTN|nr:hypothetical protein F0344_03375 [Streptomyces finlayi]
MGNGHSAPPLPRRCPRHPAASHTEGTPLWAAPLMIEIRRDAYMREPGGPAGSGLTALAAGLAALVDALSRGDQLIERA